MNRLNFLKTANALRDARAKAAADGFKAQTLRNMAGFETAFETSTAKLTPVERAQLLATFSQLLERERRMCRARAQRYDAGRHIGLYLAVNFLAANKNPGA